MSEERKSSLDSIKGCLFMILVVFVIPILIYKGCGGDPADDIIHRRNFEKRK